MRLFSVRGEGRKLPDCQIHLVEPDVIIRHGEVAIHLKGDVQFAHTRGARAVITIHNLPPTIYGYGNEVSVGIESALKFPGEVVPHVCL